MNNKPVKNPFWYVFGPLVIYWGVSLVVSMIVSSVLVLLNVNDFASIMSGMDPSDEEAINIAMQQCTLLVMELEMKYAVQIQAAKALGVIPVFTILFFRDRKAERVQQMPVMRKAPLRTYGYLIIFALVYNIGVSCLAYMAEIALKLTEDQTATTAMYQAPFAVQIVGIGILIPLMEELLFRGMIYKRFRKQSSFSVAAIGTAVLFALMHTDMIQMLNAVAFGVLLAYVYEKYGSFKAPAVLHMAANLVALIGTKAGVFSWLGGSVERLGGAVIVCAFIGAVMFVLIQRMGQKEESVPRI